MVTRTMCSGLLTTKYVAIESTMAVTSCEPIGEVATGMIGSETCDDSAVPQAAAPRWKVAHML